MKQFQKKKSLPCLPLSVMVFLLLSGVAIKALDLEGAKETPCFEIKKTAAVDPNWLMSSGVWYYPLMSKLELYYTGLELTDYDASELQENDLYYESCLKFEQPTPKDAFEVTGFADKRAEYVFTPSNATKDSEVQTCHFTTKSGKGGSTFATLTDNSTFFVTAICWNDNQMTWGVTSPYKRLPKETVAMIHEHAETLGFNKKCFTGLQYEYCD